MQLHFDDVFYYWRKSMYAHVHTLCNSFFQDGGVDPLFLIWVALASGSEVETGAALATLCRVTNRVSVGLVISVAHFCVYKLSHRKSKTFKNLRLPLPLSKRANFSDFPPIPAGTSPVLPLTTRAPANKRVVALVGWIEFSVAESGQSLRLVRESPLFC
jgi:tetratricopeptide repeat protein 21B